MQQYRGDRYPDGAWIGYASTEQAAVWVVTDDRTTTRQVLDSATPVGEVDANGCATRVEMAAPSSSDRLSVCRYDRRAGSSRASCCRRPTVPRLAAPSPRPPARRARRAPWPARS